MSILIVTGTNTDVGKTIATAAIVSWAQSHTDLSVTAVKPIQTGEPEGCGDLTVIQELTGLTQVAEVIRYPEPLAPNLAAQDAGMPYADLSEVAQTIKELDGPGKLVLVEGAGGLLVRLGEEWTVADLAKELEAPLIVVTSTGLGSLNAAELTVEAARSRGVEVVGLIGGSFPADPDLATKLNIAEFPRVTGVPFLGSIPEGAGSASPEEFKQLAQQLDLSVIL